MTSCLHKDRVGPTHRPKHRALQGHSTRHSRSQGIHCLRARIPWSHNQECIYTRHTAKGCMVPHCSANWETDADRWRVSVGAHKPSKCCNFTVNYYWHYPQIDARASLFHSDIKEVTSKSIIGYFHLGGSDSNAIIDWLLASHSYIFPQAFDVRFFLQSCCHADESYCSRLLTSLHRTDRNHIKRSLCSSSYMRYSSNSWSPLVCSLASASAISLRTKVATQRFQSPCWP